MKINHAQLFVALLTACGLPLCSRAQQLKESSLENFLEQIKQSEYDVRWIANEGVHKAANRAQNLRFTLFEDGFAAEIRDYGEGNARPWEGQIRLKKLGKSPLAMHTPQPVSWALNRNAADALEQKVKIEYRNLKEGLRQNFLVQERPAGGDPLTLEFATTCSGLRMEVDAIKNQVAFYTASGELAFIYTDLNVFDANGVRLEARFVQKGINSFLIGVNDESAVYPILVDPLSNRAVHSESQSGAKFGFAVATSRGTNLKNLLIGAPNFDNGSYTDAGKVFVIGPSSTWSVEGQQAYGQIGWSVANIKDVADSGDNGDAILIGAPYYDSNGYTDNGKAWVYKRDNFGVLESTPFWSEVGSQNGQNFGYSVSWIGNFNSSGGDDFAVGSPKYNMIYNYIGIVSIFTGSSSGVSYWGYFNGSGAGARLGHSLAFGGDIDANGAKDFVAGMPGYSSDKGAIRVFRWNGSSFSTTDIVGENTGDQFGFSVAGVGDVDGDGYHDVLVGAPYYENGQTDEGKAYLFKGQSGGINTSAAWTAESDQANAHFGWSVAGDPDNGELNNDAYSEFVIGCPDWDSALYTNGGKASFYTGSSTGPNLDTDVIGLSGNNQNLGYSVSVGIIDGDLSGFIVGAPGSTTSYPGGSISTWYYSS